MTTRIYQVTNKSSKTTRLIEATSSKQALLHIAQKDNTVRAATTKDLTEAMRKGEAIEVYGAEESDEREPPC